MLFFLKIQKWICGYLAKILRMKVPSTVKLSPEEFKIDKKRSSKSLLANIIDEKTQKFILNDDFGVIGKLNGSNFNENENKNGNIPNSYSMNSEKFNKYRKANINEDFNSVKQEIHSIMNDVHNIAKKIQENEDEGDKSLNWKFAAMVLDKLCLYVFGILTFSSTGVILLTSPNFFKLQ